MNTVLEIKKIPHTGGEKRNIMKKDYTIVVAGTGDGDIIGTTKRNLVKSRLLAA